MAKADFKLPDEFLTKLSRLGKGHRQRCGKGAGSWRAGRFGKGAEQSCHCHRQRTKYDSRSTGELAQSLGLSPVKLNRAGNHDIKIGFSEPRSDGGSNAKIANILEYGKSGQPPKPFLKPAKSAARAECIRVMEQTLKEEVEKL